MTTTKSKYSIISIDFEHAIVVSFAFVSFFLYTERRVCTVPCTFIESKTKAMEPNGIYGQTSEIQIYIFSRQFMSLIVCVAVNVTSNLKMNSRMLVVVIKSMHKMSWFQMTRQTREPCFIRRWVCVCVCVSINAFLLLFVMEGAWITTPSTSHNERVSEIHLKNAGGAK